MEGSEDNVNHVQVDQVPVEDLLVPDLESVEGGAQASGKRQRILELI